MTPDEYAGAILAHRIFGRLQVHQMFRDLAAEYGITQEALAAPARPHRPMRLVPDTFLDDAAAVRRGWLLDLYMSSKVLRPEAYVVVASVA